MVNVEEDATAGDLTNMVVLLKGFKTYVEALAHVVSVRQPASPNARGFLTAAFWDYLGRLLRYDAAGCDFKNVRDFHLAFHKKRAILGIDDPAGSQAPERDL